MGYPGTLDKFERRVPNFDSWLDPDRWLWDEVPEGNVLWDLLHCFHIETYRKQKYQQRLWQKHYSGLMGYRRRFSQARLRPF